MAQLRFKGFQSGTPVSMMASDGVGSLGLTVPAFQAPQMASALPRISSTQAEGDTLTLETSGLTGISAYAWRRVGGSTLGTGASFDSAGQGGQWIECAVTSDQGVLTTPAVHMYMGMPMASHNSDDAAILALCPHHEATHIAVANGDWSDPAIWFDERVPSHGARVLVPQDRQLRYDANTLARLDWVRVDGRLDWSRTSDTTMLVETLIGTRGSVMTWGLDAANPVAEGVTSEVIWSGRHYRDASFLPTDINLQHDPLLWGRGLISQGEVTIYGAPRAHGCMATVPVPAGATSLTLEKPPTGWKVGDTIVISGLELGLQASGLPWRDEDEERVISAITGHTVSWDVPLVYDHNDKMGLREDIRPAVQLKRGRNVIFRSEITKTPWRRGHFAMLHGLSRSNIRYAEFFEMGRTAKSIPAGIRNENGEFETHDANGTASQIVIEPFTARSNLQGRYPAHWHHVGHSHEANGRPMPIFWDCYIEGSPGWGAVHHACEMHMFNNSVRRVWSGGIVAESGNETGVWNNNIVSHMTAMAMNSSGTMVGSPKGSSENGDRLGDPFRHGQALALRSRAVVLSDNIVFNCTSAINFTHRRTGGAFVLPIDHRRENLGLQSIGQIQHAATEPQGEMEYSHHPLLHVASNTMMACWFGFFVTKEIAPQTHDTGIKLHRNTVWGCLGRGFWAEYVVAYGIDNWDIAMAGTAVGGWGRQPYHTSTNAFQIAFRNCRAQGRSVPNNLSVSGHTGSNGAQDRDVYDPDNRRFYALGNDFDNLINYTNAGAQTETDVLYESDDWDNTELDYARDPEHTYPLVVGTWNGSSTTGSMTGLVTNSDGAKISNFTSAGKLAEKPFRDSIFSTLNAQAEHFCSTVGYYEHEGGYVLLSREIISDELSARPAMQTFFYQSTSAPNVGNNNGTLDHVTTPISATDQVVVCAAGGNVVIDALAGATGGNGTIVLDDIDIHGADRGTLRYDTATGEVTYTPFFYVETGVDEFYVFLRSGDTMFKTVRVNVLIGAASAPETPAENMHFTASSGSGAGEIDVTLLEQPDAGGRNIRLVQYSTDNGASWRRLTNLWPQTTLTVTHESSGAPLSAGSYTLRLRYHHDHEYADSVPSASMVVAVG